MRKYNESKDQAGNVAVESLKVGEYVQRVGKGGTPMSKVYRRAEYDREQKKYCLNDTEDASRCIYVKKGTLLNVGFTY